MGKLIYAALTSLDGYISDEKGGFGWAEPREDVHSYVNKLELDNGTLLLGKNMYETLVVWEDFPDIENQPDYIKEYQSAWKKMAKVVYSTSLKEVTTLNTILKREFDKKEIEKIKRHETRNIGIGGANIASQALAFSLIDEVYQFLFPIMIGSGKKWLSTAKPWNFECVESKNFLNGVVMLHYKILNEKKC
jgi:dihydrofolate reductase